ncbi:MAG: hypothetical protein UY63_C0013G0013 [Parcubacteria group bacterium GW2011_GWA2_51_10]|nr:MAG: hypothetical protein UY63_C0013G0013 [Parcubacteria group bacterium GW2011_GWA2_51_10]
MSIDQFKKNRYEHKPRRQLPEHEVGVPNISQKNKELLDSGKLDPTAEAILRRRTRMGSEIKKKAE